ncbi:MAG: hypothetical protein LCH32_08395 [Bacteroidetes bacterium]|nr:hypothetical protein [Bacteroidota bacterium]
MQFNLKYINCRLNNCIVILKVISYLFLIVCFSLFAVQQTVVQLKGGYKTTKTIKLNTNFSEENNTSEEERHDDVNEDEFISSTQIIQSSLNLSIQSIQSNKILNYSQLIKNIIVPPPEC